MQVTSPQSIAALLPFISTSAASWLSHDRLSGWVNALIAFVALVGTAALCVWLAGNFTGNAAESVSAVLLYVGVLMNGQFAALQKFLVAAPSPLVGGSAAAPAARTPAPPQTPAPGLGG